MNANITGTVPLPPGSGPWSIAFDGGNIWVAEHDGDAWRASIRPPPR